MKTALVTTVAGLAAAAIVAPVAQASPGLSPDFTVDPVAMQFAEDYGIGVCVVLDKGMTRPAHFDGIGRGIMEQGLTAAQAGQVIGIAVASDCPEYSRALKRWINS